MSVTISNWCLPGGAPSRAPQKALPSMQKRYDWVKKKFLRTDAALDEATGDVHVYNTGYLYGAWKDGTTFETTDIWTSSSSATARLSAPTCGTTAPKLILHKAWFSRSGTLNYAPSSMVDTTTPQSLKRADLQLARGKRLAVYIGLNP